MLLLTQADFDGELDAAQAATVAAHRIGCRLCQSAYDDLLAARQVVREGASYHRAPASLRRAVGERLAAASPAPVPAPVPQGKPSLGKRLSSWWSSALGAGLGAAVAAAAMLFLLPSGQQSIVDQVVAGHVRALQPGHLEDVASSDRHTVKPWFDGRLDFAPPVKDLKSVGFPLEGGRLDYIDGRNVAALVYGHGKHPINMFVWPAGGAGNEPPRTTEQNGYNVIHWVEHGMNLWVVSDLEQSALADFVRRWRAAS
jgi:anti-sigma factor RsiW